MSERAIDSSEALKDWFRRGGVTSPLRTCIGPLPTSRAAIARWSADKPDTSIQNISAHADCYRISIMLEAQESQIWSAGRLVWSGMIGAHRFRISPPGSNASWRRLSGCDIVNIFIPVAMVNALGHMRDGAAAPALAGNSFVADRHVLDLALKMLDAEKLAGRLAMQFCDSLMTALVAYLLEHYAGTSATPKASSLDGARLRKVLAYMTERMADEVSVADLADAFAMSESHFSREFRNAVGLPPHQYLVKRRLERAREILLTSDARVIDVAIEHGFANASHFSRAFAHRFGMAPAAFRRLEKIAAG